MFPVLRADLPVLRRGPDEIQLGVDPAAAVVVTGLSPAEIDLVERLDGSVPLDRLVDADSSLHVLVRDLTERGIVDDAHVGPPTSLGAVVVDGDGPASELLVAVLRRAGLTVRQGRAAVDELDLAVRAGQPSLCSGTVQLVIRVTAGALSPVEARLDGVDCLPVLVGPRSVSVGPVITGDGPCLLCLDLSRADRDPAWAHLLAQAQRLREPRAASAVTTLAASLAASRALAHLRGDDREASETSVEMALQPVRLSRRTWHRHPRCHRHPVSSLSQTDGDARTMET